MIDATATLDSLEADMWRSLYRCRYDPDHRKSTVLVLANLLSDGDTAIKQRAMSAVAKIGHCDTSGALADLVPLLCTDLQHEDELTRRTAVGALFAIGSDAPDTAVPALVNARGDEAMIDVAMLALIEIGDAAKPAAPSFRRFATHHNGKRRRLAIRGLGAICAADDESRAILATALFDPNKRVREMAQKVIRQMDAAP